MNHAKCCRFPHLSSAESDSWVRWCETCEHSGETMTEVGEVRRGSIRLFEFLAQRMSTLTHGAWLGGAGHP
jgi:hypothetical protein